MHLLLHLLAATSIAVAKPVPVENPSLGRPSIDQSDTFKDYFLSKTGPGFNGPLGITTSEDQYTNGISSSHSSVFPEKLASEFLADGALNENPTNQLMPVQAKSQSFGNFECAWQNSVCCSASAGVFNRQYCHESESPVS